MITVHMIVKNEENFVWFAVNSVLNFVDQIIIYDTGSEDKTVEIIKSIKSSKIHFEEKGQVNPSQLTELRNEQIKITKSEWFMILDGDEVWPEDSLKKLLQEVNSTKNTALAVRSRNCVEDIFHYLPENRGRYQLLGIKGHLNIRAFKKSKDSKWVGDYPLEAYSNNNGPVNNQKNCLSFLDIYYWHLTHLKRTSVKNDFKKNKKKLEMGMMADKKDIPEIFFEKRPEIVPDPFVKLSFMEKIQATLLTIVKDIKYKV